MIPVEGKLNKPFDVADKYCWNKNILKYLKYHPIPKILIVQSGRISVIVFFIPILSTIKRYLNAILRCVEILDGNYFFRKYFI
jgi:hypothetical protein